MARPAKEGLDYFSFDVDFFDNKKVRKIMRGCGPTSALILTSLLCNIYQNKGYYSLVDDDLPFDIADKIGVSEGAVNETITKAVQVNFFSEYQFKINKILTSEEIVSRYKAGTLKRENVLIDKRYTVYNYGNEVSVPDNQVSSSGNTQSKVKESKVNKSKEAKAFVAGATQPQETELKKEYQQIQYELLGKDHVQRWIAVRNFIRDKQPSFIEPYFDAWNIFAMNIKLNKELQQITDKRRKKFNTRIQEPDFKNRFLEILEKIKSSPFARGDNNRGWKIGIEFILESQENYTKILENRYDF